MLCILCVLPSDQTIYIFDEDGLCLNIGNIITKHFWVQPNEKDLNAKAICCSCWSALDSFHKFFLKVEEAHAKLASVKLPAGDEKSEMIEFDAYQNYLDTDIKLESHEDSNGNVDESNVKENYLDDKIDEPNSDSDSESGLPLTTLVKCRKTRYPTHKITYESDTDCDYRPAKSRVKRTETGKESKRNPNMYSQRVSPRDFDEVIKEHLKLSCEICHIPLTKFFLLKRHYRSVHNIDGYVTCCDTKFQSRHKLVSHIFVHKNPEYFKCQLCSKVLTSRKGLNGHMIVHLDDKESGEFKCSKCQKSFQRKERLERHLMTHEVIEQICEQCGIVCRDKNALRIHQQLKHNAEPRPRVNCEKCGLDFASKTNVKFHMKHHHPASKVTHQCSICGKISSNANGLKRHIAYMHRYERDHKCTMCEKGFKTGQRLRVSFFVFA